MMWLDTILIGGVALAALAWAALSAYILGVQRQREATRATLASTLAALEPMSGVPARPTGSPPADSHARRAPRAS